MDKETDRESLIKGQSMREMAKLAATGRQLMKCQLPEHHQNIHLHLFDVSLVHLTRPPKKTPSRAVK